MRRSALEAVARTGEARRRVREAVANNQNAAIGFAALGTLVVGGAVVRSLLYTAEDESQQIAKCVAKYNKANGLDSEVNTAKDQADFNTLQANWTKAAEMYLKAGDCAEAQYALGRLCSEGRGYVYDPAYGEDLYRAAAAKGNSDARYALACAALRTALTYNRDRAHSLYEASVFLAGHARSHEAIRAYLTALNGRALSALSALSDADTKTLVSDFNAAANDDPAKWSTNTRDLLIDAAKTSDDARAQIVLYQHLSSLSNKIGFISFSDFLRDPKWPGKGGWGAKWRAKFVRSADSIIASLEKLEDKHDAVPNETLEAIDRLFALGRNADTTANKYLASIIVEGIKPHWSASNVDGLKPILTNQSQVLMTEAAEQGNARAILSFLRLLDNERTRFVNAYGQEWYGKNLAHFVDLGVSAGSREARKRRAEYHNFQNNESAARRYWADAAKLGCSKSLANLRASHSKKDSRISDHHYPSPVSPLPAALEMTITESPFAVVVSESEEGHVVQQVEKYLQAHSKDTPSDTSLAIKVAWPQLDTSGTDGSRAALDALQGAYAGVFVASGAITNLIVEPMPAANFGAFEKDAPVLTARALLGALSEHNITNITKKAIMCVSDDTVVVVEYDRAFRTCARALPPLYPLQAYKGDFEVISKDKVLSPRIASDFSKVALVLGYGTALCADLSRDGWSVDTSLEPTTLAEKAVKKWLTAEVPESENRNNEINHVFRATIASARGTVTVDCEQDFADTLLFASTRTDATDIAKTVRRALSRNRKYGSVYVSIDSFLEHVEESKHPQFRQELLSAFSIGA